MKEAIITSNMSGVEILLRRVAIKYLPASSQKIGDHVSKKILFPNKRPFWKGLAKKVFAFI